MDRETAKIISELTKFKDKIKERIKLEKIIVFGSRIKGNASKDSDIDIVLVSIHFAGKKYFKRAPELYDYWHLDYPFDLLCYTPQEFEKMKNRIGIVKTAVEEGIEL